jgi:hypothetical protein
VRRRDALGLILFPLAGAATLAASASEDTTFARLEARTAHPRGMSASKSGTGNHIYTDVASSDVRTVRHSAHQIKERPPERPLVFSHRVKVTER